MLLKCSNKVYGTATTAKLQYFSGLQIFLMKHFIWVLLCCLSTEILLLHYCHPSELVVIFQSGSQCKADWQLPHPPSSKPENRYIGLEGCYGTRQESKLAVISKSHILAEDLCNGVAASHELFLSELFYFPVQPETY